MPCIEVVLSEHLPASPPLLGGPAQFTHTAHFPGKFQQLWELWGGLSANVLALGVVTCPLNVRTDRVTTATIGALGVQSSATHRPHDPCGIKFPQVSRKTSKCVEVRRPLLKAVLLFSCS